MNLSDASDASSPAITCRGVTVTYGQEFDAVRDVNLTVHRGEMIAMIGPSGCGKTTLLRTIAGLESPSRGQVQLASAGSSSQGRIGFVFQQPALLPWATTVENVMLPLDLIGPGSGGENAHGTGKLSRAEKRAAAMKALQSVQLADAWDKRPHELSGGMKMRASIARALVTDPSLLLLDEPFAALDEMLRTDLGKLLIDLWQEKRFTAVMVTHNISESILLSKRIAVMRSGQLESVIDNPLPWPREHSQMRTPAFAAFFGQVSDQLRGGSLVDESKSNGSSVVRGSGT